MEKRRTRYDHSFKENAEKLSYERKNLSELSRELVIPSNLIYRCRKESEEYGDVVFNGAFNFNDADNEDAEYNYDQSGNVEQVNHYYPYGGTFGEGAGTNEVQLL